MGFFKKDDIQEKEVQVTNETKIENLEIDKRISKRKIYLFLM